MTTLYHVPTSRALRVLWTLEEIGATIEVKSLGFRSRLEPEYLIGGARIADHIDCNDCRYFDDEPKLGWLCDRQIGWFCAPKDLANVDPCGSG
jgi:hypothetical protein